MSGWGNEDFEELIPLGPILALLSQMIVYRSNDYQKLIYVKSSVKKIQEPLSHPIFAGIIKKIDSKIKNIEEDNKDPSINASEKK